MATVTPEALVAQAAAVISRFREAGLMVATAESCTGGLIAGILTEVAGASDVVDCGFVTYSNAAKQALLGVPDRLLAEHGAVSGPVARAMAEGALARSGAGLAVAVTGIAGPGGGSPVKPVGLVYAGCATRHGGTQVERHIFPGDRTAVRLATVAAALALMRSCGP